MKQDMGNGIYLKKMLCIGNGKSGMRTTWTYKLGQIIISTEKEDKDLAMAIHDNLSPEKS